MSFSPVDKVWLRRNQVTSPECSIPPAYTCSRNQRRATISRPRGPKNLLMKLPGHRSCATLLALLAATASSGLAHATDIPPCGPFTQESAPQPAARGDERGLVRLERINQAVKMLLTRYCSWVIP